MSWTGAAAPTLPGVVGDEGATVMGDAESGFTVTPGAGAETVEVTVPDGLDITDFLDIPVSEGTQFIASATVREDVAREPFDPDKGAVVDGKAWTPAVTVKGGASGFYTIRVSK